MSSVPAMMVRRVLAAAAFGVTPMAGCAHHAAATPAPDPPSPTTPVTSGVLAGEPLGPLCDDHDLDVSVESSLVGSTHRGVRLRFALAPGVVATCVLTGYPGVYTNAGGAPQLHAEQTPRGYLGGLPTGSDEIPLALITPTRPAHAVVEGIAVDDDGNPCPEYTALVVNPPKTTGITMLPADIEACRLQVHPVTDFDATSPTPGG